MDGLLFDEPTANLDWATADALSGDLLTATVERATMLITHRLAALDIVDKIVLDGHYFKLWQCDYHADRTDGSHDG
jgi:ATP-binding cassette, subfamily C, bacterial CydCD